MINCYLAHTIQGRAFVYLRYPEPIRPNLPVTQRPTARKVRSDLFLCSEDAEK